MNKMNKKLCLAAGLILLAVPVFSFDFITGYGVSLGANFDALSVELSDGSAPRQSYSQFNFGGLVFFEKGFLVADLSFGGVCTGFIKHDRLKPYTFVGDDYQLVGANVALGAYFKYPFRLDSVTIFATAGLQGILGLSQVFTKDYEPRNAKKDENYGIASDWSVLAFKAGAGVDIDISENMFFRSALLINYRLNSALDNAFIYAILSSGNPKAENFNMGFEFEFLLGYKIGEGSGTVSGFGSGAGAGSGRSRNDDDIYYPK
jgi:opacity protein-like surface antigen